MVLGLILNTFKDGLVRPRRGVWKAMPVCYGSDYCARMAVLQKRHTVVLAGEVVYPAAPGRCEHLEELLACQSDARRSRSRFSHGYVVAALLIPNTPSHARFSMLEIKL